MAAAALSMSFLLLIVAQISAFYFLDHFVRHEYEFHRQAWLNDHNPAYLLFWPPEATWGRSRLALTRLMIAWLFWTPRWICDDSTAKQLLSRYRLSALLAMVGSVLWLLFFFRYLHIPV
jgi:hypothetical protein